MKLMLKINPKQIFRSKKSRSDSRSDPSSFSSGSASSDSSVSSRQQHLKSDISNGTPKSVLPSSSMEISSEWSELMAGDVYSELVQAFKMIDRDGDGKITRKELEAVLNRVGRLGTQPLSDEEVRTMLSEVDRDGDGCISLEEFSAISSAFGPPACGEELRDTFNFFDADHDGLISPEELQSVFAALGDDRCTLDDCRRMISVVDENGDGFVCFEDFARMMELQRI